ncbi:phage tail sheath subtilisin-like domain-containing protein [Collimonas pratensis]|uniref:Phage tail sheath family protein n=1 Tax=Collimonas pratensis TaxID=279113 RepID=A0ABN4M5Z7_9BURK|nr:phage tail sheath subtilisin-like domain-containing protein [Collimonas pratensis]AMP13677.1 phage tail sheath family protein [Collimonas pratensis]
MADNVSFREIPADVVVPGQYIEIDGSRADSGTPPIPRKIIIMGQKLATGAAVTAVPTEVPVGTVDQVVQLGGRGSVLAQIAAEAFKANPYGKFTVIASDDLAAGVAATGSIVVTGPAVESGTISLYVDGTLVQIGVTKGDTGIQIAANIATQINANPDLPLSVPVAPTTATLALVAKHKGECGNDLDVRDSFYLGQTLPSGVILVTTAMAGGTGNPDVGPLLAAIKGDDRIVLISPWTDSSNVVKIEADFADRYGPMKQQESHCFAGISGTYATLVTYGSGRNSPHISIVPREGNMVSPWRIAASVAGLCSLRGSADPARPFFGMVLPGIPAPAESVRFDQPTRNNLLKYGLSTLRYDAGGNVMIEMVTTTYKTNSFGVPTRAYFKLQSKWTADYFRYAWKVLIATRYPDFKLADDGTNFAPGQPIVTPSVLRIETIGLARTLEYAGIIENVDEFKKTLLILRSIANPNQVNAVASPNLVNQFDIFAAAVKFIN